MQSVIAEDRQKDCHEMTADGAGRACQTGAYQTEADTVTEAEWSELMGRFADANIYQTWSYGAVRWQQKKLSHLILKSGSEVLAMAQLRILRPGNLPCGVAYLRWGPMCQLRGQDLDPEIVRAMAAALRREYVERQGLHLEILPNAFSGSVRAQIFQSAFSQFDPKPGITAEEYRTFVLDLSPSLEELRKKLDGKWRNMLNGAEKNGLRVTESNTMEAYGAFRKIYAEMWSRKKFHTSVDIDEFGRIQERLSSDQRMHVLLCLQGEEPVAGIACSAMGDSAIYLLGATGNNGLKSKGGYLLQWAMIRQLRDHGVRYYDLGGIDREENPGVYLFKRGLSGTDSSHIGPFIACDSIFSAAFVRAGQFLRRTSRKAEPAAAV